MDVVLDTTDLLPALVSRGRRRAFLTLCRYGRASLVHLTYSGVGFASLAVRVADLPEELPRLASDLADDHVASTAIYGRAEALVTSEKALLNDGVYEHEGQSVEVMTFDKCASRIENPNFSLSQVPEILSIPTR